MDHQVMMKSLKNFGNSVSHIPFTDDPQPYNGCPLVLNELQNIFCLIAKKIWVFAD